MTKDEVTRQDPTFKSQEAVDELLAMPEDQMIEALFQMEMTKAVSVIYFLHTSEQLFQATQKPHMLITNKVVKTVLIHCFFGTKKVFCALGNVSKLTVRYTMIIQVLSVQSQCKIRQKSSKTSNLVSGFSMIFKRLSPIMSDF